MRMKDERFGYASVRGELHKTSKLPNQDAYLVNRIKKGTILVVSDGMGSHVHSEIGAKAVCKSVSKAIQLWIEKGCDDIRLLIPVLHALWGLEIFPLPRNECGATCLFAFIAKCGKLYLGQLGDGSVFFDIGDGISLLKEKDDEFANMTVGINNIKSYADWSLSCFDIVDKNVKICLMTDGVSETLVENKRNDFVNLVWKRVAEKNNVVERNNLIFKLLDQWNSVNAGDDRTLISYEKK